MIKLNNLSFSYKNQPPILNAINYEFQEGKIYLIKGNNGSGKTTLLKLLLGFLKPSSGNIIKEKNKIISYLPDSNGIYDDLSIHDNIKFRLALYNMKLENKYHEYQNLLKKYHLENKQHTKVKELSLGMKKKTALIATLLIESDIYIFDEPTGRVDEISRMEIIKILNTLEKEHKLIICITHEKELINHLNAEILTLSCGELQ